MRYITSLAFSNHTPLIEINEYAKSKKCRKKIWDVEGFDIAFHQKGKNVHGAKEGIPQYPYLNAAKNDMTVNEWKKGRFGPNYPGFDVVIYDADGNEVPGQTKISTVRDSYLEQ